MNSNTEVSDDHIIQIPLDHTPNQSHEQTPIATSTNSPTPKHGSRVANEMTPEELSSLKEDLKIHIWRDEWLESKSIIDKCPDMVCNSLNDSRDTALHLAVSQGNLEIVNGLVECMRPEDMLIPNSDGMFPLHLAALSGSNRMVDILSSNKVLDIMDFKDIERLFLMTVRFNMFDLAMRLFEKHPTTLAIARNEEDHLTALHMLAQKPPEILDLPMRFFEKHRPTIPVIAQNEDTKSISLIMMMMESIAILGCALNKKDDKKSSEAGRLFIKLLTQVNQLEHKRIMELITHPSSVLFDAIESGNVEAVNLLIDMNRKLVTIKDGPHGRNLLHLVVLLRQKNIFISIRIPRGLIEHLVRAVDNDGNNILHLAAHLPQGEFEELSSLRASIQIQIELEWFKFVESNVPGELRTMRNNMNKRPIDVFYDEHKKLSEEIKETAKGIAESGMLVSTLVATVAFAAALTVPGHKTNAWFTVFILTNAVALFTSSASLLSFLSNFTSSRFAHSEFVKSLHPSLTIGRWLLIISVAAMVVAFTAASFLIFDHTSKWVSYAVASMGAFPILLFLLFQFKFLDKHLWSRYYRLSKQD